MYKLLLPVLLCSCNGPTTTSVNKKDSVIVVQKKPSIPLLREKPERNPVKQYVKPLSGDGLQGNFSVQLFETKKTFHYLMRIKYAELDIEDTLKLPNFGMQPQPELKQGSGRLSCIVGFYDEEKKFREYKLISVKSDRVSVKTLQHYAAATYQNEL